MSGLLGVVGVLSLIVWLANLLGALEGVPHTGLIIERPVAGLILVASLITYSAWQWWVLNRPQVGGRFSSKPA
jgi:hypothetical protein